MLLRLFLDGAINASELEVVFLRLFKDDTTDWPPDIFDVLDSFFADVDDYCRTATALMSNVTLSATRTVPPGPPR